MASVYHISQAPFACCWFLPLFTYKKRNILRTKPYEFSYGSRYLQTRVQCFWKRLWPGLLSSFSSPFWRNL